jgi:hypothetical protein
VWFYQIVISSYHLRDSPLPIMKWLLQLRGQPQLPPLGDCSH